MGRVGGLGTDGWRVVGWWGAIVVLLRWGRLHVLGWVAGLLRRVALWRLLVIGMREAHGRWKGRSGEWEGRERETELTRLLRHFRLKAVVECERDRCGMR